MSFVANNASAAAPLALPCLANCLNSRHAALGAIETERAGIAKLVPDEGFGSRNVAAKQVVRFGERGRKSRGSKVRTYPTGSASIVDNGNAVGRVVR